MNIYFSTFMDIVVMNCFLQYSVKILIKFLAKQFKIVEKGMDNEQIRKIKFNNYIN